MTTKAQFAKPKLWGEAEFQQSLMRNAVVIYEKIKNNPGIRFEDDMEIKTAITLEAAGLIKKNRGWWYIVPHDECDWFER